MFCEVVLSRTPSGDLFWDQEGTKCNRWWASALLICFMLRELKHLLPKLWKCLLFRFEPEAGLIALTLANGAELNYRRRATSQFVTSEIIWHYLKALGFRFLQRTKFVWVVEVQACFMFHFFWRKFHQQCQFVSRQKNLYSKFATDCWSGWDAGSLEFHFFQKISSTKKYVNFCRGRCFIFCTLPYYH